MIRSGGQVADASVLIWKVLLVAEGRFRRLDASELLREIHHGVKESAAKLPENPEVQYHFGMASLKMGDKESARNGLTLAIASPVGFARQ